MKEQHPQPRSKAEAAEARKQRLAQALRENLAKRKGQGRVRGTGKAGAENSRK